MRCKPTAGRRAPKFLVIQTSSLAAMRALIGRAALRTLRAVVYLTAGQSAPLASEPACERFRSG